MQLILATFTEAPHNPAAAFLAACIIAATVLAVVGAFRSIRGR